MATPTAPWMQITRRRKEGEWARAVVTAHDPIQGTWEMDELWDEKWLSGSQWQAALTRMKRRGDLIFRNQSKTWLMVGHRVELPTALAVKIWNLATGAQGVG